MCAQRRAVLGVLFGSGLLVAAPVAAQPYDFADAKALLDAELPNLSGRVAVIVRQDGRDIFRYQAGSIDYSTQTRLASFTKTLSAAVVLALRDEGVFELDETIGQTLPLFVSNGLGEPTRLDCFGMRHGIVAADAYEINRFLTLTQSVNLIGLNGTLEFAPGSALAYEGLGMQVVGRIAEVRTGQTWEDLARTRLFDLCNMPQSDFDYFDPNPAIAGGARSSADETMRFAEMVINGGEYAGQRVLSQDSVDQLFTNSTQDLPVVRTPWPSVPSRYPYGQEPDYGFGTWIFAQDPQTDHVEEVVGAGAWGSYIWLDRRRGITAVLITDVPPGSMASGDAALGLMEIVRTQVDAQQVGGVRALTTPSGLFVHWDTLPGATGYRVYTHSSPIENVYDLREATLATEVEVGTTQALVSPAGYVAVTASFDDHENLAMTPRVNAVQSACAGDIADDFGSIGADGQVSFGDFLALLGLIGPCPSATPECAGDLADDFGTLGKDGQVSFGDFLALLGLIGPCP